MNLRQVEIFRVVMTSGTTARAAEILHVSQPAVSKMIQELERSLGFHLFQRIKGRLHPTQEGQLFFREVEQAFLGLAHLRGAAARIRDYGSGELRIACLSALSTNVLPRALQAFMTRNPNVAITFQARMSSNVRDLVASGQFDLGIVADEIDSTGVAVEEFARFRVAVAMPQGHPLETLDVVHPSDLDGHRFIALAPKTPRAGSGRGFRARRRYHPAGGRDPLLHHDLRDGGGGHRGRARQPVDGRTLSGARTGSATLRACLALQDAPDYAAKPARIAKPGGIHRILARGGLTDRMRKQTWQSQNL